RCKQATYCDVIPLEIAVPPTLRPADEFFVSVALDWKTTTLSGTDYTRPTKGKYSIVVFNHRGPNTGYRLTVSYRPERIVPPFESLAPDFNPPRPAVESPAAELPVELAVAPAARAALRPAPEAPAVGAPPPPATAAAPALTLVAVDPDPDFSNFSDEAFDRQLAAPAANVLAEKQAKAAGPPPPASAGSLVFWLAAVPLLLVAAGGLWLWRKGSAVLKLN